MKRMLWFIIAMMAVALCAPVMAQTFTDVPTDHWAYQAVQELSQRGLIVGYPDGTFGGKRALTRYEFAMAISRMLPVLRQIVQEEIGNRPGAGVSRSDFDALERRVAALESRPQGGVTMEDLDRIRRLVDEFREELATLGVDVDNLKREVADLKCRMDAVEETIRRLPRVSAESNIYFRGEATRSGRLSPRDIDGRTLDADNNILEGIRALYDVDLRVEGNVAKNVTAHALFNGGNYVNWLNDQILGVGFNDIFFPNDNPGLSTPPYIAGFPVSGTEANDRLRTWLLYFDTPISLGFLRGMDLTVGKFPYQLSPYFLRMPDVDSYSYNYKTDSGDYPMLGGAVNTKVGPLGLALFAGKHRDNAVPPVGGFGVPLGFVQTAGARLSFGVPFLGNLALNYMRSGTDPYTFPSLATFDEYSWWGADLNTTLPFGITVLATWAQSQPQTSGGSRPAGFNNRSAIDARASIPIGRMTIGGGYRKIDPNFSTPGYWGKIGYITNPVDIEGPMANINIPLFRKVSFTASGEWYHGLNATYNPGLFPISSGLTPSDIGVLVPDFAGGDRIRRYVAGFRFDLTSTNRVDLGVEQVRYRPAGLDVTKHTFINIGYGHSFNPNTSIKLLYQIIDMDNPDGGFFWGPSSGRGAVAETQFSVRF